MELNEAFKSIIDTDPMPVVICDLDDIIVYMNDAAKKNYSKHNGGQLTGFNVKDCHNEESKKIIDKVVAWFAENESNNVVHTFFSTKNNKDVYMYAIRDSNKKLIGYYEKHECRTKDESPLYEF